MKRINLVRNEMWAGNLQFINYVSSLKCRTVALKSCIGSRKSDDLSFSSNFHSKYVNNVIEFVAIKKGESISASEIICLM